MGEEKAMVEENMDVRSGFVWMGGEYELEQRGNLEQAKLMSFV